MSLSYVTSTPSDDQCPICLEGLSTSETITTGCNHTYHRQCLRQWLEYTFSQDASAPFTCAYCRQNLQQHTHAEQGRRPFAPICRACTVAILPKMALGLCCAALMFSAAFVWMSLLHQADPHNEGGNVNPPRM